MNVYTGYQTRLKLIVVGELPKDHCSVTKLRLLIVCSGKSGVVDLFCEFVLLCIKAIVKTKRKEKRKSQSKG